MTQLAVATGHRNGQCHFRLLSRSAQHTLRSLLHGVTFSLLLLLAVVYGREHPKLSGGLGVTPLLFCHWHCSSLTKDGAAAAVTYRPVAGSSDDLAFQRQAAVISTSPLGRLASAQDPATLLVLHSCRRHCIRIQISFDNLG